MLLGKLVLISQLAPVKGFWSHCKLFAKKKRAQIFCYGKTLDFIFIKIMEIKCKMLSESSIELDRCKKERFVP